MTTSENGLQIAGMAPGDASPLLEVQGLHKWFGAAHVLKGIDLTVFPGEIVCIIGPSGSGKSTLLRCVNHLEPRDAGEVTVDGLAVGYENCGGTIYHQREADLSRVRQQCGMVFQHFNLFAHMSALENVAYCQRRVLGRSKREARDRAVQLLERVGLRDRMEALPAKLSGGQQQRVAIARALAMDPKLMLFDEPTSALDAELVGEVLRVMADLAASGMTMLIVTHEIRFAREVADIVVFMDEGVVVERGSAAAVLDAPQHPRTAGFLGRITS
jgi:polar amino acid transport system ATP-binding protein